MDGTNEQRMDAGSQGIRTNTDKRRTPDTHTRAQRGQPAPNPFVGTRAQRERALPPPPFSDMLITGRSLRWWPRRVALVQSALLLPRVRPKMRLSRTAQSASANKRHGRRQQKSFAAKSHTPTYRYSIAFASTLGVSPKEDNKGIVIHEQNREKRLCYSI